MANDIDQFLREQNNIPARVEDLDPPSMKARTLIDEVYTVLFDDKLYEPTQVQKCVIPQTNQQARMNGFHGSLPMSDARLVFAIVEYANSKEQKGRFPLIEAANDAEISVRAIGFIIGGLVNP